MARKTVAVVKGNPFAKKAKGKMDDDMDDKKGGKKGFVPFKKKKK
jgi:hypothetical protein